MVGAVVCLGDDVRDVVVAGVGGLGSAYKKVGKGGGRRERGRRREGSREARGKVCNVVGGGGRAASNAEVDGRGRRAVGI